MTVADYATVLETTGNVEVSGDATVENLKAASVTVDNGTTLTSEIIIGNVTLGADTGINAGNGTLVGLASGGNLVGGNVVITESTDGTLDGVIISGNVTAWGKLFTDSNQVTVGGYVAIDAGAEVGYGAALNVVGSIYICDGAVEISGVDIDNNGLNTLGTIYVSDVCRHRAEIGARRNRFGRRGTRSGRDYYR